MSDIREAARALQAFIEARQQDRLLRLHFPYEDGPDALLVPNELHAHEALSRDFHFTVELLSESARIELKDVQGKMVTIELVREDGSLRYFNGYVFEFRLVKTDSGYAHYDMVLLPWLAYLRLHQDNYLFHGQSLYEQTESICRDYKVADWQIEVRGDDEPMTDACQFGESDYNYLHRRWEAKGWHYRYEHRKDGHTLILGDDSPAAPPIDGDLPEIPWQSEAGSEEDDGVSRLTPVRRIVAEQVALSSFDFKHPRPRHVDVPTLNKQGDVLSIEIYEYTGAYGIKNGDDADRLARLRMEEVEASGKHFEARSNDRYAMPGRWFRLTGHFDAKAFGHDPDQEFLILEVTHRARNNYLQASGVPALYFNDIICIRKTIPWRPGRGLNSEEPKIYGLQTAIVVGPKGEEIYTDKYGRIRVQFHWDRVGRYNEFSSAWIRVSQPWAGDGWGAIAIPRVGQEVVVQFLDGNPDRPLVTGSLFNAANMPPYALPAGDHMMGFKSNSTPGGGGYSEMVIHDMKGRELVNIHAQKDMVTTVQHTDSTVVNGPKQTVDVTTGFQETKVKQQIFMQSIDSEITVSAATRITLQCGASKIVMDKEGNILIEGKHVEVMGSARVDVNR